MAIYDPKVGEGVIPSLPKQVGFNVDEMTFGGLDSAIKSQVQKLEKENETVDKSISLLTGIQDKTTNFRIDNSNQQAILDEAKKTSGVENVFNTATLESLKSPYGAKMVEAAYAKFVADPKVAQVVMEQSYADKYQKDLAKINDAKLREMALQDYQKYRNGEITGDALVADDYMEVDIPKILGQDFKSIAPKVEEHMRRNNTFGANYVESMKVRDNKAMELVFENRLSDPKFVNNLVAKGFYDRGTQTLTDSGREFVDALLNQYQVEELKMKNVRHDKQVNKYEVNKNSTFTGTYNGTHTSTSTKIGADGTVTVGSGSSSTDKKAVNAVNIMQNQVGPYGINAGRYEMELQDPKKMPSVGSIIRKAVKDPYQDKFAMLAMGFNAKEVAKDLLARFPNNLDMNTILKKYGKKARGKDSQLYDALTGLTYNEQSEFIAEAILKADEYAKKYGINTTAPAKTTKTKKTSVRNIKGPLDK